MRITLDDGSFKWNALESGDFEGYISESGGEVAAIVAAEVALALLIALRSRRLGLLLRLGRQQLIERLFYDASNQFLDFPRFLITA